MKFATVVLAVFLFFQGCASAPAPSTQRQESNISVTTPAGAGQTPVKGLRLAQPPAPAYTPPPVPAQYSGTVTDAPQDHSSTKSDTGPSVAYKQMFAPRWGGNVRQVVFYNGCDRQILSQYPPSDEMARFWDMLLTLPPKQGLNEWGTSYYARWAPINGRWTLVEGSTCLDKPCPQPQTQIRAPQYQAPVVQQPAPAPQVYYQPATPPQVIYQAALAPAPASKPRPRVPYSNPACVKQLEEWGYSGRDGIIQFQKKLAIKVDGVAGPETCRYVSQILAQCEGKDKCEP